MNRIFKSMGILLLCSALLAPPAAAQTRGRSNNPAQKNQPAQTRPSTQPGTTGGATSRPGNSGTSTNRPGNSGNSNIRPGNMGQGSQPSVRPGSSNNRPGNSGNKPGNVGNRPGNTPPPNGGSIGGQRPNYQPAPPPRPQGGYGPQHPHFPPAPHSWHRPTPPPSWRPPSAWRTFNSILGIALGTSLNISLNTLIHNGYTVSQYGTNTIYVNNVPMLNMMWPNAVMYYNNVGGLCGSRFIYTSQFYDMTRYNSVYATLVNTYGSPYSFQNNASGIEATWWGTNNQFITLSYVTQYTPSGTIAYYTTLSFGI